MFSRDKRSIDPVLFDLILGLTRDKGERITKEKGEFTEKDADKLRTETESKFWTAQEFTKRWHGKKSPFD
jgi:hypothetical protein